MAQSKNSSGKKSSNSSKSAKKALSPSEKRGTRNKDASSSDSKRAQIFDEDTRHDIFGVLFCLLGIVLFVAVVWRSDALITSLVAGILRTCLGLGSFILPFLFVIIGASFFIQFDKQRVTARFTIGLSMIFIAILTFFALLTPAESGLSPDFFALENVTQRGGFIGAGIAFALYKLFGQTIAFIVMIGVVIAGLAVIGLSISSLVQKALALKSRDIEDDSSALDAEPYARIERQSLNPNKADSAAPTGILPKRNSRNSTGRLSIDSHTELSGSDDTDALDRALTRKLGKSASAKTAKIKESTQDTQKGDSSSTPTGALPRPQDGFQLPDIKTLKVSSEEPKNAVNEEDLAETGKCLQETLEEFGVFARVVDWIAGPTVTLFKIDLPSGVRVSKVTGLQDDIALALAAPGVRIFAPIPGTNYVGIEVPNKQRKNVFLGDILPKAGVGPLQIAIGMDVEGRPIISDLAKMPHLLIGGTTGSGKSVSINAMIMSILMRATPSEVRLIMIDPKRVEFTPYNGIPHLYVPVVTEPREAASALSWGCAEMERRLKIFQNVGARNISQYNTKVQLAKSEAEAAGEDPEEFTMEEMCYLVIIIDELADLMMNAGKEVEFSISRIAQLARAAGIHLIVATQRPAATVVTGLIKANITNRIAFNVASGTDSRVILDSVGAESLIGLGDLLFSKPEFAKPQRIQGCYVSEDEINEVVEFLKNQGKPEYHSEILKTNLVTLGGSSPEGAGGGGSDDPLIWEAAEIIVSSKLGSTSNIQRRLKVGYSRAGRIMDMLEEKGIVGPPNGSKPREVLVDELELETLKAFEGHDDADLGSFTEE